MVKIVSLECAVCGSNKKEIVGKPAATSEKIQQILQQWESVVIVKCKSCGFYYTEPMPIWSQEDLQVIYNSEYFKEPSSRWKKERINDAKHRCSLIRKYVDCDKPRFLDVGCGHGIMMKNAVELGWHTFGLEPSRSLAEKAMEFLGEMADIHIETLQKHTFQENSFDVLYLDSVLEHIAEVGSMVRIMSKLLKSKGLVYLLVPNEDCFAYIPATAYLRIFKNSDRAIRTAKMSPLINPYHIVGFNKNSLLRLFLGNGFTLRYMNVFRGIEDWEKREEKEELNLNGRIYNMIEGLFWSIGGLVNRGKMIEAIFQRI